MSLDLDFFGKVIEVYFDINTDIDVCLVWPLHHCLISFIKCPWVKIRRDQSSLPFRRKHFLKFPIYFRPSRAGSFSGAVIFRCQAGYDLKLQLRGECGTEARPLQTWHCRSQLFSRSSQNEWPKCVVFRSWRSCGCPSLVAKTRLDTGIILLQLLKWQTCLTESSFISEWPFLPKMIPGLAHLRWDGLEPKMFYWLDSVITCLLTMLGCHTSVGLVKLQAFDSEML